MGLVGVLACGSFETDGGAPVQDTDGGRDGGKTKKPNDAGAATETDADAGDGCKVVIQSAFDTSFTGGWTGTGDNLGFGPGPEGIPALLVQGLESHGDGDIARSYLDQKVSYPGLRSVHTEFDFAYDQVDPNASFGCVTNLQRSAPFGETRIQLARDSQGLEVASGFSNGGPPVESALVVLVAPNPHVWTHVTFDLSVGSDGTIERKYDFGGQAGTMPSFVTPDSSDYDTVHILCGVNGLQGTNSKVNLYLKSLVVTACKKT
jgi:hypothetical protein